MNENLNDNNKKTNNILPIIIIILLVVLIGLLVFILLTKKDDKTNNGNNTENNTETNVDASKIVGTYSLKTENTIVYEEDNSSEVFERTSSIYLEEDNTFKIVDEQFNYDVELTGKYKYENNIVTLYDFKKKSDILGDILFDNELNVYGIEDNSQLSKLQIELTFEQGKLILNLKNGTSLIFS